jgi:hypothetical protein
LEGAHVVDGLSGAGEAVLGANFCGLSCGGTCVGAGLGVPLGVAGAGSPSEDVAGLESSGGHGGQEGGEEGACENGTRTPTGCEELEGAEVVACAMAGFQHGAEIFDRINRIDRISEFFDRMIRLRKGNSGGTSQDFQDEQNWNGLCL